MNKLMELNQHQSLPTLTSGRTFIVGDLHGSYDELISFLSEWGFDKKTERVIGVGDLIDRGNKNFECLQLLNEPWFYSVLGNHEYILYDIVNRECCESLEYWILNNGGDWVIPYFGFTYKDFIGGDRRKDSLIKLIEKLKPLAELIAKKMSVSLDFKTDKGQLIGICHAATPGYDWKEMVNYPIRNINEKNSPIWSREQIYDNSRHVEGVFEVCHGHSAFKQTIMLGNRNYLDTGLCVSKQVGFKIY